MTDCYNRIGYVTQRAVLFSGDIRENVLFGESRGGDTDGEVRQALELAQAGEFVNKLPKGIHAPVAEGGTNLSGGQKQRGLHCQSAGQKSGNTDFLTIRFPLWITGQTPDCGQDFPGS